MARDAERWHSWVIPIAIVVGALVLRFTDRVWLVDVFDGPGLSESGNFATGATWAATVVVSIFAALGALAMP